MTLARIASHPPLLLKLLSDDLRWQIIKTLTNSDYRVSELTRRLKKPTNLVSYHLKRLNVGGLVKERRSSADARDVYYTLDLDRLREMYRMSGQSLHPALNEAEPTAAKNVQLRDGKRPRILFLCTHNSARSQMAEALLRQLSKNRVEVFSAGTEATRVHPDAIRTMATLNIDISQQRSKHLDEFREQKFDYVITVCDRARESCPLFPGDPEQIHWSFPDPAAEEDAAKRRRAFEQTAQQLSIRINFLLVQMERSSE